MERKDGIDLALTDMMMPVMNEPETIRKLLEMNLQLGIIAASGLDVAGRMGHDSHAGVRHFFPKPYSAGTLPRRELDERRI